MRHIIVLIAVFAASAAAASPLPAELEAALAAGEAHADQRWAFTLTYHESDGVYTFRYDPSQTDDNGWALVSPAFSDLSEEQRQSFEELIQQEDPGAGLTYKDLRGSIGDALEVFEQTPESIVYRFTFTEAAMKTANIKTEHVVGEAVVDRRGGYVSRMRIFAPEPFKPVAVAKINRLNIVRDFARQQPGGPVLATRVSTDVAGSAMFQKFEQSEWYEYSDVFAVDAAPDANGTP